MKSHSGLRGIVLVSLWIFIGYPALSTQPEIKFIENKCQWPESVKFLANTSGGSFILNRNSFSYIFLDKSQIEEFHHAGHQHPSEMATNSLTDWNISGHKVDVSFSGANQNVTPIPFGRQPEYYNYFLGNNSSHWSSHVAAYEGVLFPGFYPGVDLKVYSQGEHVKYEFIVEPGANLSIIQLNYEGTDQLFISEGDLVGKAGKFSFIEKKPYIYQVKEGEIVEIKGEYVIQGNTVSFRLLDDYDACFPLVIDPILIFSTYSGSTADNWGSTATPGEHGTLYSAGVTNHQGGGIFPTSTGAFQQTYGGVYDIGILKYDSTGGQLLYATYLGGSGSESPHSLVVNQSNELLVLGTTGSSDFPTSLAAYDRTYNGGTTENNVIPYPNGSDIFVAKINRDGSVLMGSTLLGGSLNDGLNPTSSPLVVNYGDQLRGDIITDSEENIYVSTVTSSADFPVKNSFGLVYKGGSTDALLIKLKSDLTEVMWSAFVGGNSADASHTIKFDPTGNVVFAGGTSSTNFPTTAGVYQTLHAGSVDGWIARVDKAGAGIINATFTGTAAFNQVYFIDLDADGNVYAYGQTSGAFPTTTGVYKNSNSGQFLQKFSPALSELKFSTVFGSGKGIPDISPTAFMVNDCNNIYMSGWGGSINNELGFWNSSTVGLPVTNDAFQKTTSGSDFYFILLTSDASQLLYATYLGGTQSKTHVDGGTSRFDKSGIVYHAVCAGCAALNPTGKSTSDFPTTPGAWSQTNKSLNCNNAAFKFDLSLLKARLQTNSVALTQPGLNRICLPDKIVFQNKSTGGQFFEWDFGDGRKDVKTDTSKIIYQYENPGVYKVKLVAIDQGTCVGIDSTFTTISVFKSLGAAGPDQTMCFNAGVRLSAAGGVQYNWASADNVFKSTEQNPSVNPEKDTRYFVTITDINGCSKKDTVDIKVVPGIDLQFEIERMYDCFNRPVLDAENLTDSEERTFFDFGDGTTSDLTTVQHTYESDGTYLFRLVGERDGCVYEKSETVPIYTLLVPNVITPDDHPENNSFKILYGGVAINQAQLDVTLKVYNRWGNLVYSEEAYQGDWSGEDVEPGVYFYELLLQEEMLCKGWVKVIK